MFPLCTTSTFPALSPEESTLMATPCIVIATFTPLPEHYEEVKRVLLDVIPDVHREEGCELYALHEEVSGSLVFIEKWASRELWRTHSSLEPVVRITKGVQGLLATEPDVREMYGVDHTGFPGGL